MFLVPSCLKVLSPKLQTAMSAGSRIVTYHYPLPADDGWIPVATRETEDVVNVRNRDSRKFVHFYSPSIRGVI